MSNPRVRKIADRIQVIVAEMLERRIKDPRLGFVTVTDVRRHRRHPAGVGLLHRPRRGRRRAVASTAAALESAKGLIRSEVAKQLGMRHAPTLEFIPDALPENARHLDELLARAREQDAAVAAAAAGATYAGDADPYKKPHESTTSSTTRRPTSSTTDAPSRPGVTATCRAGRRRQGPAG